MAVRRQDEVAREDERALVGRILGGDTAALAGVVERLYRPMAAIAAAILPDASHVDDVVQDAWVRVLGALGGFELRASLRTWILRIVANCARTRAAKLAGGERLGWQEEPLGDEPAVDPARFSAIGRWRDPPRPWRADDAEAEAALLRKEVQAILLREIAALPPGQRAVVTLRDLEGLAAAEVCELLGLSEANQRVLLHRARARLRAAIERELGSP